MSTEQGTRAPLVPVFAALIAVALVIADRLAIATFPAWVLLGVAGVGIAGAIILTLLQENGTSGWARVVLQRIITLAGAGAWAFWADVTGWNGATVLSLLGGTVALALLGAVCQVPAAAGTWAAHQVPAVVDEPEPDWRPRELVIWEQIIRRVTKLPVVVLSLTHWDRANDGMDLVVQLPAEMGTTAADLAPKAGNIAASAGLPRGCVIEVEDGDHQGVAILHVMLRNALATDQAAPLHVEPTSPASINDTFPVMSTARGDLLSICLRIATTVLGGTTGSGKTTLLHRIIMFLARCTDALIWVVDYNGGGVARPWIKPYLSGEAEKPVVDWVATTDDEAAVMVAVASAIARDRKSNPEAERRKEVANDTVLPVDERMPAIVILVDEGGEVKAEPGVLAMLALEGLTKVGRIGRAEGVRTIMSILRGTSDLLEKGLRVVSGNRLCLRMLEHGEYEHVLGATPPKANLGEVAGLGFIRLASMPRPVLARTVNVDLASMRRHAIATARLRPDLDEYALAVAARISPREVMGNKEPAATLLQLPALRDCLTGRAYIGRWERYRAQLDGSGDQPATSSEREAEFTNMGGDQGGRFGDWGALAASATPAAAQHVVEPDAATAGGTVIPFRRRGEQQPAPAPAAPLTAREQILALVRDAGADGVATGELVKVVGAVPSRVHELIKELREAGTIGRNGAGHNVLAQYAQQIG